MKKILLAMALTLLVLPGCDKIGGCQQPFSQEEIPELTLEGYNTCEAVVKNYKYLICDGQLGNYPFWSHEGDTIKVCGYFYEGWDGGNLLPLYDCPDNQIGQLCLYIGLAGILPDGFVTSKKCYIEGVLCFNPLYTNSGNYYIVPEILCIHLEK